MFRNANHVLYYFSQFKSFLLQRDSFLCNGYGYGLGLCCSGLRSWFLSVDFLTLSPSKYSGTTVWFVEVKVAELEFWCIVFKCFICFSSVLSCDLLLYKNKTNLVRS